MRFTPASGCGAADRRTIGHEPNGYLRHTFTELPEASSPEHVTQLLPFNTSPQNVAAP